MSKLQNWRKVIHIVIISWYIYSFLFLLAGNFAPVVFIPLQELTHQLPGSAAPATGGGEKNIQTSKQRDKPMSNSMRNLTKCSPRMFWRFPTEEYFNHKVPLSFSLNWEQTLICSYKMVYFQAVPWHARTVISPILIL